MPPNPVSQAARQVVDEIPERYDNYRADLLKALSRIVALGDPRVRSRRQSTEEIVGTLADQLFDNGGVD